MRRYIHLRGITELDNIETPYDLNVFRDCTKPQLGGADETATPETPLETQSQTPLETQSETAKLEGNVQTMPKPDGRVIDKKVIIVLGILGGLVVFLFIIGIVERIIASGFRISIGRSGDNFPGISKPTMVKSNKNVSLQSVIESIGEFK